MDPFDHFFPFFIRNHRRLDGLSTGRQLIDDGNIQVCEQCHGQGPGYGCRSHDQLVGLPGFFHAFFQQGKPLVNTEAVLFVNNDQAHVAESNLVLEQGVGADNDHRLRRVKLRLHFPFFGA